jgi:hypothetical protein
VLKLAEALKLRSKQPKINYIATIDFLNLAGIADFEGKPDEAIQSFHSTGLLRCARNDEKHVLGHRDPVPRINPTLGTKVPGD